MTDDVGSLLRLHRPYPSIDDGEIDLSSSVRTYGITLVAKN